MKNKLQNNCVWMVDDDEGILEVVKILFEQEQLQGRFFYDPEMMKLELNKGVHPKLLLLDVFMKGVNGVDVSLYIKSNLKTNQIPIILLTADIDAKEKAQQAHAEGFLMKPFDIEELLAVVKGFLPKSDPTHDSNHSHHQTNNCQ